MTKNQTFEQAFDRLEQLVSKLEGGEVQLDEMLQLYEEGAQLIKYCMDKLDHAEKQIKQLRVDDKSEFNLEPFDEG
jgi:exodeoxyribonuclease VII small subunit